MPILNLALLAALVAVQVADLVTTTKGLQRPDLSEANKAATWLFGMLGQTPTLVLFKLLTVASGVLLALLPDPYGPLGLAAVTGWGAWVVHNNLKLLRQ